MTTTTWRSRVLERHGGRARCRAGRARRGLASAGALVCVAAWCASAEAAAPPVVVHTYGAAGDVQKFVVPDGVRSLQMTVVGGSGGMGYRGGAVGGLGGPGTQITGNLAVNPGESLALGVGSSGAAGSKPGGGCPFNTDASPGGGGGGNSFRSAIKYGGAGGDGSFCLGGGGGGGGADTVVAQELSTGTGCSTPAAGAVAAGAASSPATTVAWAAPGVFPAQTGVLTAEAQATARAAAAAPIPGRRAARGGLMAERRATAAAAVAGAAAAPVGVSVVAAAAVARAAVAVAAAAAPGSATRTPRWSPTRSSRPGRLATGWSRSPTPHEPYGAAIALRRPQADDGRQGPRARPGNARA